MSEVSTNVYRASWLAWPTRVMCWPLAAIGILLGVPWLLLRAIGALCTHGMDPEDGLPNGLARVGTFLRGGARYLGFLTDHYPSFDGRLHAEGDAPGPWWEAKRRLKKSHVAMFSVMLFVLYAYVGVLAQARVIAADYQKTTKGSEYVAPDDDPRFVLGTDALGHDVASLALRGATTALWIGVFASVLSCGIGIFLGALAGYYGGRIDEIIVWLYTTLSSIPYLLLLMAISYVFKNNPHISSWYADTFLKQDWHISMGLFTIILAVGLTSWVGTCRIVRAEFIKHRERDYVQAALSMGLPRRRVIFKHILPNVFHLALISFSLLFIGAIKFEVILSFLGLGLEPEEASWGNMISAGAAELMRAKTVWWQISTATVALFGLVLSVNLFADALRDALDPRLRK
jgi:ABC-type dipeptide/oligopeptide/nickel transport system permease subunit